MRIAEVTLSNFRRFTDLRIEGLPQDARLVVLAGPNGCGKSSLFDAFYVWQRTRYRGISDDKKYYWKGDTPGQETSQRTTITFFGSQPNTELEVSRSFCFRSAYRNDPEFSLSRLDKVGPVEDERRFSRMIESDAVVTKNYHRLASDALQDAFDREDEATTLAQFRERTIGSIRSSMLRLFPDLVLNSLGNPLTDGTFRFTKGIAAAFEYKNLSGGEKAAFDLILDMIVKRRTFDNSIYCIDEPEAHMNTRLQGQLLEELLELLPANSQLWVATHSIGMMRKAREIHSSKPNDVAFLDFGGCDFDEPATIGPCRPTRTFWEGVLSVALDDLASLVAPQEVVVCEGNPAIPVPGKNSEHDSSCYNIIFADEFPDTKFISAGNSHDVTKDRLSFVAAIPLVAKGIKVRRLVDRDDHSLTEISELAAKGIKVLSRRHLECFLYDDEVLAALCDNVGQPNAAPTLLAEKQAAIAACVAQGKPNDDVKSAAGLIYTKAKQLLQLRGAGSDQRAFARVTLAPLIKPGMGVYQELKQSIFAT